MTATSTVCIISWIFFLLRIDEGDNTFKIDYYWCRDVRAPVKHFANLISMYMLKGMFSFSSILDVLGFS